MSFADPGVGRHIVDAGSSKLYPPTVVLADTCEEGDILGYNSGWVRACGVAASLVQPRYIALKRGASGNTIPVSMDATISGYIGGTAGGYIYADYTTAGKVTDTVSTTPTDSNVIIGILTKATEIMFFLNRRADSVVPGS